MENKVVEINQFDDIGWYYDLYMGDIKIKKCESCGKLIKIKSKTKPEKYCENCAIEKHREINKESMRKSREV